MPRQVRTACVFAVAMVLLAWAPVFAGVPTERLREFFLKVNAILGDAATEERPLARVARIRRLVNDIADMRAAAATAFGPTWETRTAAERDEFTAVFAELIERAYVGRLAGLARGGRGLAPIYLGESVTGDAATVTTLLRGSGHDLRVEYRMTQHGVRWRVRDIVLDGVSIVDNYRAQFRRLLQAGSQVSLVAHMRAKLAEESYFFARSGPPPVVAATPAPPATRETTALADDVEPSPLPPAAEVAEPRPVTRPAPVRAPRVTARAVSAPAIARPTVAAILPAPVREPVVTAGVTPPLPAALPAAPPTAAGRDLGLWIAALSVLVGAAIVYFGWRAPGR